MEVKSSFRLFLSKYSTVIVIVILGIISLLVFLPNLGKSPLVDYDEGTYARVIHDTRVSGDITTLQYFGRPWFEKPPLYFWTAIASVSVFGENEFTMRLSAVIFSLLTLLFTFLIAKRLSNIKVAIGATLILLFSPLYHYYSTEIRVDTGVLMGMMAALYFFISGWEKPKFLLGVLPAIAVGFMMKDVIALLIIPIALFFAFFYKQWRWLRSKFFWFGLLPMAIVAIPWHLEQHLRFGSAFWNDYIGYHVVDRAVKGLGIGIEKSTGNYWGYFQYLWVYAQPLWIIFILLSIFYFGYWLIKKRQQDPLIVASFITVLFFITIFTLARTQIITYILPIFPFIAIILAGILAKIFEKKFQIYIIVVALFVGLLIVTDHFSQNVVFPYHMAEKSVATKYKQLSSGQPLYVVEWPIHESIRYYSGTKPNFIGFAKDHDVAIPADSYFILNRYYLAYFLDSKGIALPEYGNLEVKDADDYLLLLYTNKEISLKSSGYKEQ